MNRLGIGLVAGILVGAVGAAFLWRKTSDDFDDAMDEAWEAEEWIANILDMADDYALMMQDEDEESDDEG